MPEWKTPFELIKVGTGRKIKDGEDIAILTIGAVGNFAVQACVELANQGINAAHYDIRFVKPLDEKLLHDVFSKFDKVITVEDGCILGGMGSAVVEFMAEHSYNAHVKRLGMPDKIIEHGEQKELYAECEYDVQAIIKTVEAMVGVKKAMAG
jgi:1-deoxy-D-xylulose-5-phosphate synthase